MTGAEIAVGYIFAWLVAKARRLAGHADAEVDRSLDAGMERLHVLVSRKLRQDPALERAGEEAEAGHEELSERTRRRLSDSLEDAAEHDPAFREALQKLVGELQGAVKPGFSGLAASGHSQTVAGNAEIHATGGSAAALHMGDVAIGGIGGAANPRSPGPDQG